MYEINHGLGVNSMLIFIILVLLASALIALTFVFRKATIVLPDTTSQENLLISLRDLYKAIKNKNMRESYLLFTKLSIIFNLENYETYHVIDFLNSDNFIFLIRGYDVIDVHWNKCIESYIVILKQYRAFDLNRRYLSIPQIDEAIDEMVELNKNNYTTKNLFQFTDHEKMKRLRKKI